MPRKIATLEVYVVDQPETDKQRRAFHNRPKGSAFVYGSERRGEPSLLVIAPKEDVDGSFELDLSMNQGKEEHVKETIAHELGHFLAYLFEQVSHSPAYVQMHGTLAMERDAWANARKILGRDIDQRHADESTATHLVADMLGLKPEQRTA